MDSDVYLRIRDVSKSFGSFAALKSVALDVRRGEFISFLGPSGCGKTTLLRAIAGFDVQTSGEIWQNGRNVSALPVRARDFGIVFQSYALFPNLTIRDNVAYGLAASRRKRAEVRSRVDELLELVGLSDQAAKYPVQLSGGQQQRVALARALALAPGLLLLDEPLSALDARVRARLRGEIRDLQRRLRITAIMVTHDQEEALTMSDRVVVMNAGRIEQVGTPDEIYRHPTTQFVADFVGRMNFLQGRAAAPDVADVQGARLRLAERLTCAVDSPITVCIRPEDIVVRDLKIDSANRLMATVGMLEFVGHHFATTLRACGTSLEMQADLSINDVQEVAIRSGAVIAVALPPERLRVFSDQRPA